jgi:DNA (cytosine-5)-methyltransferase 1
MAGRQEFVLKPLEGLFAQNLQSVVTIDEAIHDLPQIRSGKNATTYRDDIEPTLYESFIRNGAQQLKMHEATVHSPRMLEITSTLYLKEWSKVVLAHVTVG